MRRLLSATLTLLRVPTTYVNIVRAAAKILERTLTAYCLLIDLALLPKRLHRYFEAVGVLANAAKTRLLLRTVIALRHVVAAVLVVRVAEVEEDVSGADELVGYLRKSACVKGAKWARYSRSHTCNAPRYPYTTCKPSA